MINDELISRKEVIDRLQKAQNVFLKHSPLEACGISYAREIIASEVEIPTIEKRPQGEWIIDGHHRRCNYCNEYTCTEDREGNSIPDNFCPFCGADMREGGKFHEEVHEEVHSNI